MANSKNITFDQLYSSLLAVKEYAAEKEHGTHVIYATTSTDIVPGEQGVAGSANNCAKGDHTHSIPPYPTELKSPGTLSISLAGDEPTKYDGSVNKDIEISYSNIGASPAYHSSSEDIYGKSSELLYGHAKASSTTPKESGTASVGTEISSFARGDHVHPEQVNITGNAVTATKLLDAVTIIIGDSGKAFDGSNNLIWTMDEIGIEYATDEEVSLDVNNIFS